MLKPLPTQLSGAKFLADRKAALLADEPRVGKTGAAVIAADYSFAEKILVITTASGRGVWNAGLPAWSKFDRRVQVIHNKHHVLDLSREPCVVVGWPSLLDAEIRAQLLRAEWDVVISDEDHYAKDFNAKRTQALYGVSCEDGAHLNNNLAIYARAKQVWCLTGTPLPNSPLDMYPRLRALAPNRLRAHDNMPDVTKLSAFKDRYCVIRPMRIGKGAYKRFLDVVVRGKNEHELAHRLNGFMLKRTQKDVGIREPIHELLPLIVTDALRRSADADLDKQAILEAAKAGDTRKLELHLGPLRRLTGELKARAVVEAVKEEFACGLDKIVLMRWHTEVGAIIREGLKDFGVVSIDGSTSACDRKAAEDRFRTDPKCRVFDGQIQAAGEAIDLSAAAVLIFVETSLIPKDMKQASLRITNHTQTRQAFVRVATLQGSIDEALQDILLRKWSSIREVLGND